MLRTTRRISERVFGALSFLTVHATGLMGQVRLKIKSENLERSAAGVRAKKKVFVLSGGAYGVSA